MATSLLAQAQLCQQDNFRQRVEQAVITAAIAITNEAGAVPNHINRANFAALALREPQRYGGTMAQGVASQGVGVGADDATIQNTVNSIFNSYAGVI